MIEDKDDLAWGARGNHHHSRQRAAGIPQEKSLIKQIAVHVAKEGAGFERLDLALHLAKALDAGVVGVGSPSARKRCIWEPDGSNPEIPVTPFLASFPRGSQKLDLDMASQKTPDGLPEEVQQAFHERASWCRM